MKKVYHFFICTTIVTLLLVACSGQAPQPNQSNAATSTPTASGLIVTSPPSETATPTATYTLSPPTPTETEQPSPTSTIQPSPTSPTGPTFPPELTQTPGIIATATAYVAAVTAEYETEIALVGPLADMLQVAQYFHPVGTPVSSWHGLPVMSQAAQGQEFRSDIYSFTATATLDAASQYYNGQSNALKWTCYPPATGTAGAGSNAEHIVTLTCNGFIIYLASFDADPKQVIVVLNKAP